MENEKALKQEKETAKKAQEETLNLLNSIDVKSMQEQGTEAVQKRIDDLKAKVAAPAAFENNGQQFEGHDALQAKLDQGGALNMATSPGVLALYEDDSSLVAAASGGLALCGIGFAVDEDEVIVPSTLPMLAAPEYVTCLGTHTPFASNVYRSTEESEVTRFQNTAKSAGMSMAESTTKSWGASASVSGYGYKASVSGGGASTKEQTSTEETSNEGKTSVNQKSSAAHLTEYITMPMQSFRVPR